MSLTLQPLEIIRYTGAFLPNISALARTCHHIYTALGGSNASILHVTEKAVQLARSTLHSDRKKACYLFQYWGEDRISLIPFVAVSVNDVSHWALIRVPRTNLFDNMKVYHWTEETPMLDFSWFGRLSTEEVIDVCLRCPNAQKLNLGYHLIDNEELSIILSAMPRLASLTVQSIYCLTENIAKNINDNSNLTSLRIQAVGFDKNIYGKKFLSGAALSNITHFHVDYFDGRLPTLPKLTHLSITKAMGEGSFPVPDKVCHFPDGLQEVCLNDFRDDFNLLKNLKVKTLIIKCWKDEEISFVLDDNFKVEELRLESCQYLDSFMLVGKGITSLTICDCPNLNSIHIDSDSMTNLSIEHCSSEVSEYSYFNVVCPRLTDLKLISCKFDKSILENSLNLRVFCGMGLHIQELNLPNSVQECDIKNCHVSKVTTGADLLALSISSCGSLIELNSHLSNSLQRVSLSNFSVKKLHFVSDVLKIIVLSINFEELDVTRCGSLEVLSLHSCAQPVSIAVPSQWYPRTISIKKCGKITRTNLSGSLDSLETLRIDQDIFPKELSFKNLNTLELKGSIPLERCQAFLDASPQTEHIIIKIKNPQNASSTIASNELYLRNPGLELVEIEAPSLEDLLVDPSLSNLKFISVRSDALRI